MKCRAARFTLFIVLSMLVCLPLSSQDGSRISGPTLETGKRLYGEGKWNEAIVELRRFLTRTSSPADKGEASYWLALSELAAEEYEGALKDLDTILSLQPAHVRKNDAIYQKGRVLFHLGQYDAGIIVLKTYIDLADTPARKAAALYWIGECLYALGRLDDARSMYSLIRDEYPTSAKYEAAIYRMALIDQKAVENELLKLLKWTHEESLRMVEEYQRRERAYEQAILAYQKRIADLLKDNRLAQLEAENKRLAALAQELERRLNAEIGQLRAPVQEPAMPSELPQAGAVSPVDRALPTTDVTAQPQFLTNQGDPASTSQSPAQTLSEEERVRRLEMLRNQALEIQEALMRRLGSDNPSEER